MGTPIRGKTHTVPLAGTEAVPLSPDGYATLQEIVNLGFTVYNVKTYGAVADGVTDDRNAIQAAINAAAAASGGIVFFPPGTYQMNSGVSITTSGIRLIGTGMFASKLQVAAGSGFNVITFQAPSGNAGNLGTYIYGCGIENLFISRNGVTSSTTAAVTLKYVSMFVATNVRIFNFGVGLYLSAGLWNYFERVVITARGNSVPTTLYGFYIVSTQGPQDTARFHHCAFTVNFPDGGVVANPNNNGSGGSTPSSIGYYLGGGGIQDVMFADCEAGDCDYGWYLDGSLPSGSYSGFDCHFYNLAADGCTTAGVYVTGITAGINGAVDFDGGISGGPIGFDIENSSGITIRAIQIISCSNAAVYLNGSTNCKVVDCHTIGVASHVFINNSTYCAVANNTFTGGGVGVTLTGTSTGIAVTGNAMNTVSKGVNIGASSTCVATCNAWGGSTANDASRYVNSSGAASVITANI